MSVDLFLAPAAGFREWQDHDFDAFFESEPHPEGAELGGNLYIAFAMEAISHNLENDKSGSKFPLLTRISTEQSDIIGWYADAVAPLLTEIQAARSGLAGLPINQLTLQCDSDGDVQRHIENFQKANPRHAFDNLYDLYHHFVNVFEEMTQRALAEGKGLLFSF